MNAKETAEVPRRKRFMVRPRRPAIRPVALLLAMAIAFSAPLAALADALLDPLQDERIRCLQQYHPWFFHAPPDGEPLIQEIHITPRHTDLAPAHRA
jgi:hypothetical protein